MLNLQHNSSRATLLSFLVQVPPLFHRHGRLLNSFKSSTFSESVSFLLWSLFWCSTPTKPLFSLSSSPSQNVNTSAILDCGANFSFPPLPQAILIGSFLQNCDISCKIDVTCCNWSCNVTKSRLFYFPCNLFCNFLQCYMRNFFCNLSCNGVALQVARKITSCNNTLTYLKNLFLTNYTRI